MMFKLDLYRRLIAITYVMALSACGLNLLTEGDEKADSGTGSGSETTNAIALVVKDNSSNIINGSQVLVRVREPGYKPSAGQVTLSKAIADTEKDSARTLLDTTFLYQDRIILENFEKDKPFIIEVIAPNNMGVIDSCIAQEIHDSILVHGKGINNITLDTLSLGRLSNIRGKVEGLDSNTRATIEIKGTVHWAIVEDGNFEFFLDSISHGEYTLIVNAGDQGELTGIINIEPDVDTTTVTPDFNQGTIIQTPYELSSDVGLADISSSLDLSSSLDTISSSENFSSSEEEPSSSSILDSISSEEELSSSLLFSSSSMDTVPLSSSNEGDTLSSSSEPDTLFSSSEEIIPPSSEEPPLSSSSSEPESSSSSVDDCPPTAGTTGFTPFECFEKMQLITINSVPEAVPVNPDDGNGSRTNYPLWVELNDNNFNFDWANEDGSDIRFSKQFDTNTATSVDTLKFTIDYWDKENKMAGIWVLMDTIFPNRQNYIKMFYKNPKATSSPFTSDDVFHTTPFQSVWHLHNDSVVDATVNQFQEYDTQFQGRSPAAVEGKLGNGHLYTESPYTATVISAPLPKMEINENFSMTFWMNISEFTDNEMTILSRENGCWKLFLQEGRLMFIRDKEDIQDTLIVNKDLMTNFWYHVGITFKNTNPGADSLYATTKFYVNGVETATSKNVLNHNNFSDVVNSNVIMGTLVADESETAEVRKPFNGILDEFRIFRSGMDAGWIILDYHTQIDNAKISTSKQE